MAVIAENLTSQVDGVVDTFTTTNDIATNKFFPSLNGQVVNTLDVTVLTTTSFQLDFVPHADDTLEAYIGAEIYDISGQVDGVTNTFTKHASDTGFGDFVAIINGQVQDQDTTTVNSTTFRTGMVPVSGDKLEYFRVQNIKTVGTPETVEGVVKQDKIIGVLDKQNEVNGIIDDNAVEGILNKENSIQGTVIELSNIEGEVSL